MQMVAKRGGQAAQVTAEDVLSLHAERFGGVGIADADASVGIHRDQPHRHVGHAVGNRV